MQIREHTGTGKPAVILYPSGTVVTFDELEVCANQLAHYFRRAGLVEGDAVAILMENNAHIHAVMWAARRAGLYYVPDQYPPGARRGRLHHRQQQCQAVIGSAALRCDARGSGSRTAAGPARGPDDRRQRSRRLAALPECVADQPTTPIDDEIEGDLLQYSSSGTTGRPRASNVNCRMCIRPRRPA